MLKRNKKGFIGLLLNPIVWLVLALIIAFLYFVPVNPSKLAISSDLETQLKQEYTTYWADSTDGLIGSSLFNEKFECDSTTSDSADVIYVGSCQMKKNFYGQEVVIVVDTNNWLFYNLEIVGGQVLVVLRPHTLNPDKVDIYVNGKLINTIDVQNPFYIPLKRRTDGKYYSAIHYIGYKAQYSCDLGENEVWIQENFAQPFSIKDLEFSPTKFCKETRPFVLRDIQQGETPIYPDPIPSFNKGDVLSIPDGKIGVANYATYFVSGVNNKCAPNEANIKVADRWVCSQVIKPVEIVVQCKQDSDCYVPQKLQCFGYFLGCKSNKCAYDESIPDTPICKNEVVTVVKSIQDISNRTFTPITGINVFSFSQNKDRNAAFSIGDAGFSASIPSFSCSSSNDVVSAPSPSSDCWSSTINFDGKSFKLKDSESVLMHPSIKVQYFASGSWVINPEFKQTNDVTNFRNDDWGNLFVFTVDLNNAFIVEGTYGETILKDSDAFINFDVVNNLPANDFTIRINQKVRATNQNLPEQITTSKYVNGRNKFNAKLNTQNLGLNDIVIDVYYPITANSKNLLRVASIPLTYNIVAEMPSVTKFVVIEKEIIIKEPNILVKIWLWIKNIFT